MDRWEWNLQSPSNIIDKQQCNFLSASRGTVVDKIKSIKFVAMNFTSVHNIHIVTKCSSLKSYLKHIVQFYKNKYWPCS